jgi:hypothetical protein
MVCYQTLREAAMRRLRLKLPPLTDEEVRELLGTSTHEETHAAIDRLSDEDLFNMVMEAIRRKKSKKVEKEVVAYA